MAGAQATTPQATKAGHCARIAARIRDRQAKLVAVRIGHALLAQPSDGVGQRQRGPLVGREEGRDRVLRSRDRLGLERVQPAQE